MARYAIVDADGNVENITEWDGESQWSPPSGMTAVLCENEPDAERGGTYINGVFTRAVRPVLVAEPDSSLADKIAALQAELAALAAQANP